MGQIDIDYYCRTYTEMWEGNIKNQPNLKMVNKNY